MVLCVPATTGSTHTCTGNLKSLLPQRVPVVKRTRQPSMFFRDVTDTNQSESHSGHQQLRFTRNDMGAWRTCVCTSLYHRNLHVMKLRWSFYLTNSYSIYPSGFIGSSSFYASILLHSYVVVLYVSYS